MKKLLQISLGLILILVLSYFSFIMTSPIIENDLISKTKYIFKENNITGIDIKMQGEGLTKERVLILTGSVSTYKKKVDIGAFAQKIEGVRHVKNNIIIVHIAPVSHIAVPTPTPTPTPIAILTPKPTPIATPTITVQATPTATPTIEVKIQTTPKPTPKEKIIVPTVVAVPKVIKNIVSVPTPIKAISAPIPIKTEGVKQ